MLAFLAGGLAGRTPGETATLLAMTTLWLVPLARLTRSPTGRLIAVFLTIAGPVLYYARLEYNPAGSASVTAWLAAAVPPVGVCTTRLHHVDWKSFLIPVSVLLTTCATEFAVKTRDPR